MINDNKKKFCFVFHRVSVEQRKVAENFLQHQAKIVKANDCKQIKNDNDDDDVKLIIKNYHQEKIIKTKTTQKLT